METDASAEEFTCVVCGEPVAAAMSAECNWCDGRYHLNQRNDVEAKDCGQVWIDEQYMALQFACDNCLKGDVASKKAPDRATSPRPASTRPRRYRRRA
jgi:hypothetical protein